MDRMGYARGLVRYSTTHAAERHFTRRQMFARALRPRVLVYFAILGAVIAAATASLWLRVPLKVDVIRDRGAISREVEGGLIENVYRLQVMNTVEKERLFLIHVDGLPGVQLAGDGKVRLAGTSTQMVAVKVRAHPSELHAGTHKFRFVVEAEDDPHVVVVEKSVFIVRK
jgi:polyferredoxin